MSSLYVFNPENDLALACGKPNFTAPPMACKIRHDLQMIPIWLMTDGYILADNSAINTEYLNEIACLFPRLKRVKVYSDKYITDSVKPWGWSCAILSELKNKLNIDISIAQKQLDNIRALSNRKTIVDIYDKLSAIMTEYRMEAPPMICNSLADVMQLIEQRKVCVIKTPWSGSGRGVFKVTTENYQGYRDWIRGAIEKQGAVICEKYLDNRQDFAMEFYSDGKMIKYVGLSVFSTNNRFSYNKSIVASEDILLNLLCSKIDKSDLEVLKTNLLSILNELSIKSSYIGYFGIDMMIYSYNQTIRIMPCVELNLRTTMGHIACAFGNNFMMQGKTGEMQVLFHKDNKSLKEFVGSLQKPIVENGRLISGTIFLTPLYDDSKYTATITVI